MKRNVISVLFQCWKRDEPIVRARARLDDAYELGFEACLGARIPSAFPKVDEVTEQAEKWLKIIKSAQATPELLEALDLVRKLTDLVKDLDGMADAYQGAAEIIDRHVQGMGREATPDHFLPGSVQDSLHFLIGAYRGFKSNKLRDAAEGMVKAIDNAYLHGDISVEVLGKKNGFPLKKLKVALGLMPEGEAENG